MALESLGASWFQSLAAPGLVEGPGEDLALLRSPGLALSSKGANSHWGSLPLAQPWGECCHPQRVRDCPSQATLSL